MATLTAKSKKTNDKKFSGRKNNPVKRQRAKKVVPIPILSDGEQQRIAVSEIDFSPLNYRKFYSQHALEQFAAELAIHGIISPVLLRPIPSGRYELVVGERRLKAACIAFIKEVPALVKVLTDEEVREIQLAENLQREDPHPMHTAFAIGQMKQAKMNVEEIAVRLGKSAKFVYSRIRLLDLTEPFREMFMADVINIQEAFDIAALSEASQLELFEAQCTGWQEKENFEIHNLHYNLNRYRYDLHQAPFNIKDKKLIPEAGACTNCPFNSATLKTLFPELAKQAVCSKKECYQAKCTTQQHQMLQAAYDAHQPDAIVYYYSLSETLQTLLDSMSGLDGLPRYSKNEITVIQAPVMPDKENYTYANNNIVEDDFSEEDEYAEAEHEGQAMTEAVFDETAYNEALAEYADDLEEFNQQVGAGTLFKGLLVTESKADLILFSPDAPKANTPTVTAKEVQEAIKTGKATVELLQQEINRIQNREERSKELDIEKVQLSVHEAFTAKTIHPETVCTLTPTDLVAARLIIYQSLDYSAISRVNKFLFSGAGGNRETIFERLQGLSDAQYSYLIRMAIGCKSDAKYPNNETGKALLLVAESAGIDVAGIQAKQHEKAGARLDKLNLRTADLNQKINKLQSKAGLEI